MNGKSYPEANSETQGAMTLRRQGELHMQALDTGSKSSRSRGVLFMLMAVFAFSVIPVATELGDGASSPLLFTGLQSITLVIVLSLMLVAIDRKTLARPGVMTSIAAHCGTWMMLWSVLGYACFAMFVFALAFVDISIASTLISTTPVFHILLMSFLYRDSGRYSAVTGGKMAFVVVAMAGVVLVILSGGESRNPINTLGDGVFRVETLVGSALALIAAVGGAVRVVCTLRVGTLLAVENATGGTTRDEFVFGIVATVVALMASGAGLCVAGAVLAETMSTKQFLYATLSAVLFGWVGIVAIRVANISTDNLGVNAIAYLAPVLTLAWLWMFSILDVPHIDYLVLGALFIVAGNIVINAVARVAHRAAIATLLVFGAVIHFMGARDGWEAVPAVFQIWLLVSVSSGVFLCFRAGEEHGCGKATRQEAGEGVVPPLMSVAIVAVFSGLFVWA